MEKKLAQYAMEELIQAIRLGDASAEDEYRVRSGRGATWNGLNGLTRDAAWESAMTKADAEIAAIKLHPHE